MEQKFALLIVTHDHPNEHSETQFGIAIKSFKTNTAFLEVSEGVFLIKTKEAFPVLMAAYAQECRHREFKVRFAVIPCESTVFGAFLKVEAKELVGFGLEHLETPIPAEQQ